MNAPSHNHGGATFYANGGLVELEGREAVMSIGATEMFKPQLSAMNQIGGGQSFAGVTPDLSLLTKNDDSVAIGMLTAIASKLTDRQPVIALDYLEEQSTRRNEFNETKTV